jgi:hypothetical protein
MGPAAGAATGQSVDRSSSLPPRQQDHQRDHVSARQPVKPASSHLARRIRLGLLAGLLCLTALSVALISATPITRPRPIPRQPTTIPSCRAAFVARRQVGRSGQALATLFTATLAGFGPINRLCRSPRSFPSLERAGWLLHANSRYLQEHGPVDGRAVQKITRPVVAWYFIQLRIGSFDRKTSGGIFSAFGLTHRTTADLRLTAQIWNATDGRS